MDLDKSIPVAQNTEDPVVNLIIQGQGVFLFKTEPTTEEVSFSITNRSTQGYDVVVSRDNVAVINNVSGDILTDSACESGLVTTKGAYYWFSIDAHNQQFLFGVGEARIDTKKYVYRFNYTDEEKRKEQTLFMETLETIHYDKNTTPMRILRDPIVHAVPMRVINKNHITMNDIGQYMFLPDACLNPVCKQMYDCVSGDKFQLNTKGFPDFTEAIEYSINTPGCWCYETLRKKSREFDKDHPNLKETYLRITLGENDGESPGIPYVMEIWPVGHYSPIHSHANANAVIRVLSGNIRVSLYPFLSETKGEGSPFADVVFSKDNVTWITPYINQVHQLKNLESNDKACITIQCYTYSERNTRHYDYFDYLDESGNIQQYFPDSDMDFTKFKQTIRTEWKNRPKTFTRYLFPFICK